MPRVTIPRKPEEAAPPISVVVAPEAQGVIVVDTPRIGSAIVEIPLDESIPETTWGIHIDCELTPRQSLAARRAAGAYDKRGARLSNGRRVTDATHAVKAILEEIAGQIK